MNLIGQRNVLIYLRQAIKGNRLSPSLLFIGPDGVGKRRVAMELAQSLLCEDPQLEPREGKLINCQSCLACRKVTAHIHPDLLVLNDESQARLLKEDTVSQSAMKIESVRALDKFLQLKPLEGRCRVIIMENANRMTTEAANAMLKTLEEPPYNGQIILLSNDERNLPPTVLSRCALLRFQPISVADIARWLNKNHGVEAEEALRIAEHSGGSFSQALLLLKDESKPIDLSKLSLEEFLDALSSSEFRKESRERTRTVLLALVEEAQRQLEKGDLFQIQRLNLYFRAQKQLERHVSPRLILENLYLKIRALKFPQESRV